MLFENKVKFLFELVKKSLYLKLNFFLIIYFKKIVMYLYSFLYIFFS